MGRERDDDWQNLRNLQLFAGKDFSNSIAVENFAAETRQYIQYLWGRLSRGNCPSDEPHRLLGYFWKWQQVRSDPDQLSASLYDDYHGACEPLGLEHYPSSGAANTPTLSPLRQSPKIWGGTSHTYGPGWRAGKDYPAIPSNLCRISTIG